MKIKGSSQISHIDYDASKRELTVTFHGGAKYAYYPITATTHQQLLHAESKGTYFAENIRTKKTIVVTKLTGGTLSKSVKASDKVKVSKKALDGLDETEKRDILELSRDFHKLVRQG
jgi:hypothetical protein